jgi:hypothetical protein
MICLSQDATFVLHDKVPNRIRFAVPLIKNKQTYALMLKQSLLRNGEAKGIYHAEPNIVTGTILIKYHPAMHSKEDVERLLRETLRKLGEGRIEITEKHKNPRLGKMRPGAFFTREFLVSIGGNVIAGLILAFLVTA